MRRTILSTFLFVAILGLGCMGVAVPGKADEHCEDTNHPQYDPAECDEPKNKATKEELLSVPAPVTADIGRLDGNWTAYFDDCIKSRTNYAFTMIIKLHVKNGDFELAIDANHQWVHPRPVKILGQVDYNGRIDNRFYLSGKLVLVRVQLQPNDCQSRISVGEITAQMSFDSNCRAVMDGTFVTNSKGAAERQRLAEEKARKLAKAKAVAEKKRRA
jgi:hypothetical protein